MDVQTENRVVLKPRGFNVHFTTFAKQVEERLECLIQTIYEVQEPHIQGSVNGDVLVVRKIPSDFLRSAASLHMAL